jgi:hypothetical protein
LVTPPAPSTPLQPMKAIDALRPSSRTVPSGLTSECCQRAQRPAGDDDGDPRPSGLEHEGDGQAVGDHRDVAQVGARHEGPRDRRRGGADVEQDGVAVGHERRRAAADGRLLAGQVVLGDLEGLFGALDAGRHGAAADPPHAAVGLERLQVGADGHRRDAEAGRQVADAHEALLLHEGGDALLAHLGGLRARGTLGHGPHASGVGRPGPPAR